MRRYMKYFGAAMAIWMMALPAKSQNNVLLHDNSETSVETGTSVETDTLNPAERVQRMVRSQIHLFARTYGDSIVLRWAPEDYVSWKYLNRYGYNLFRLGPTGIDTLGYAMKPLSKEQMLAKYQQSDSLAAMAAELTWGDGRMKYNQTRAFPGSIEAMLELSEEQNMMFGFAVLISEWRRDLAEDLAMRFVDRNVKPGEHYRYILQPTRWDPDSSIIFSAGFIEDIENTRYKPEPFSIEIEDSLTSAYGLNLQWPMGKHSSFEIERRDTPADSVSPEPGQQVGVWRRINDNPFVPFLKEDVNQTTALFSDYLPVPGTYEYRIQAHDMFGDLTEYSAVHTIELKDMDPPRPPRLAIIHIDRPEEDPSAKIMARIYWTKDTLEEDFIGFMPLYYNERITGKDWKKLMPDVVTRADSVIDRSSLPFELESGEIPYMCTVDVTGLSTGMLTIAAYDRAGNMSASMPQQIRVEDMKPPHAPENFAANVHEDGTVELTWSPVNDDVAYYQVAFANDTTHMFQILNEGGITDTIYVDTLALDVNQKYIYYKVRATDYSTNEGDWSEILQVERPTLVPPTVAHLDSAWHDYDGINMRWIAGKDATMSHHLVYRQRQGDNLWQTILRCDADSVKAQGDVILVFDNPAYSRQRRYRYAVESFNTSGISSGKSLIYTVLHQGPTLVNANIQLVGEYFKDKGETRLAWETSGVDSKDDYHFSIYRKAPDDDLFRFVTTTTKGEPQYEDVLLKPGQTAEYYVKIVFKDGRRSNPSNTVTVTAPEKK